MAKRLETDVRHDTISIDWHGDDEELIANALGFYAHEISKVVDEYVSKQRVKSWEIKIDRGWGEDNKYRFIMVGSSHLRKFLNRTKITFNGYVADGRPCENGGKKILTFKEGYYHKEPLVGWLIGQLLK